jgi:DNA-binding IclR family transcriptional regulator
MSTEPKDRSNQIHRLAEIIKVLKGRTLMGLTLRDIASHLKQGDSTVLNTLRFMQAEGLVDKNPETGRWALSILMLQIAESHHMEMARWSEKLHRLTERVQQGAYN